MTKIITSKYLLCIFTALLLNIVISAIIGIKRYKIKLKTILTCVIIETIGIILGAKLLDIIINYDVYLNINKEGIISRLTSGYIFIGGALGAILFISIYSIIVQKDLEELCRVLIPNLLLVYSISKLGCFFAGCCSGISINGHTLPIQLIEVIAYFLIYIYIMKTKKHDKIFLTCIVFGITRFLVEFLREPTSNMPITITQILSIFIIVLTIKYKKVQT